MSLDLSIFDFELPEARIAKEPARPRDASLLLECTAPGRLGEFQKEFEFQDRVFKDISEILGPNDVLVLNDAKVLPVRLLGHRLGDDGKPGGAVEMVLTGPRTDLEWGAILHLSARVRPGLRLRFEPGLEAEVLSTHEERLANAGEVRVKFHGVTDLQAWLWSHGHVPLPPYIEREDTERDKKEYQTVYAEKIGSAAAPTAGFHFTPELLERLKDKGVQIAKVTLHVGIGTFRPIKAASLDEHVMHEETFEISPEFRDFYQKIRAQKKRVVAVGTTVVRTLESWDGESTGTFKTRIFIKPGYRFKHVDDLITNFHLPRSTLLVLIAAAMGVDGMRAAYRHALEKTYRFFSFGDAMLIRGKS